MRMIRLGLLFLLIPLASRGELLDPAAEALTSSSYNPKSIVLTANRLIASGPEAAEAALLKYAEPTQHSLSGTDRTYYVAWLCLLVFDPKPDSSLPWPEFGGPAFPNTGEIWSRPLGRMNSASWPRFPLAVSQGVPFLLVCGSYMLAGEGEGGAAFLKRCQATGTFRTQPYAVPTLAEAEAALTTLISSSAWKALQWHESTSPAHPHDFENREIAFLRQQVERVK